MNLTVDAHVLLTGALGSLGRAQAEALSRAGARLTLVDRPQHASEGADFARTLPSEAVYLGLDFSAIEDSKRVIAQLCEEKPVTVLINNAAMIINRPFEEFSIDEYEMQLRVNAGAAFALSQAVAPRMKSSGYGKIINFCSLTLNGRWSGYVPYVASKGALLGLTKTLARELGAYGVRVNAVSPGAVVSEAEQRVFGDRLEEYQHWILENQSIKTRIKPDDVANLVVFLASPVSDMISGQEIRIDGGW